MSAEAVRLSREVRNAVSLRRSLCPGAVSVGLMALPADPAEVEEYGKSTKGFPRNVRDLVHPRSNPGWRHRVSNSRLGPSVRGGRERTSDQAWYRRMKETECGETCDQESHRPIVPTKRGNSFRGNPVEERGKWCRSVFGTCERRWNRLRET